MKNLVKKIITSFLFCTFFYYTNAQNVNLDLTTESFLMSKDVSSKIVADGSPYINEDFSLVRITQYADKVFSARFNAFSNEMEVMSDNNKVIALDNNGNYEVTFTATGTVYRITNYVTETNFSKRGFLVVVSENENYTLLKEERIKFFDKIEASNSYQADKPAKFLRADDRYYIKIGDKVTFLPQKKNDFLKLFPEQEKKLKSYMKEKKLNPKNEEDLIVLAEYLSTIIK